MLGSPAVLVEGAIDAVHLVGEFMVALLDAIKATSSESTDLNRFQTLDITSTGKTGALKSAVLLKLCSRCCGGL